MNINKIIEMTLHNYLERHDTKTIYEEKASDFDLLLAQLANNEDLQDRKNMGGHVTSSFMLLSPDKTEVLMIYHNRLQKWLCPGGHYEGINSIVTSALRELNEETGCPLSEVQSFDYTGYPLVDVDSHPIPANDQKFEGAHAHHDFLFLGVARTKFVPTPQLEEVSAAKWVPIDKLLFSGDSRVARAAGKVINMIHPDLATTL